MVLELTAVLELTLVPCKGLASEDPPGAQRRQMTLQRLMRKETSFGMRGLALAKSIMLGTEASQIIP